MFSVSQVFLVGRSPLEQEKERLEKALQKVNAELNGGTNNAR